VSKILNIARKIFGWQEIAEKREYDLQPTAVLNKMQFLTAFQFASFTSMMAASVSWPMLRIMKLL
jgi:hypothetical protein